MLHIMCTVLNVTRYIGILTWYDIKNINYIAIKRNISNIF